MCAWQCDDTAMTRTAGSFEARMCCWDMAQHVAAQHAMVGHPTRFWSTARYPGAQHTTSRRGTKLLAQGLLLPEEASVGPHKHHRHQHSEFRSCAHGDYCISDTPEAALKMVAETTMSTEHDDALQVPQTQTADPAVRRAD